MKFLIHGRGRTEKLSGHVEVDETFIGGKARTCIALTGDERSTAPGYESKIAVMGVLERHGEVLTIVVKNVKRKSLRSEINAHVRRVRWSIRIRFARTTILTTTILYAHRYQSG